MPSIKQKRLLIDIIYFLPLAVITGLFLLRHSSWWKYIIFVQEDGILAHIQFLLYMASSLCAVYLCFSLLCVGSLASAFFYLVLMLLSLFAAVVKVSAAQEVLTKLMPEIWPWLTSWLSTTTSGSGEIQLVVHSIYVGVSLLAVIAYYIIPDWFRSSVQDEVALIVPGSHLFFYFFPVIIYFVFLDFGNMAVLLKYNCLLFSWQDQEVFKFLVALGLFFFVIRNACSGIFARLHLGPKGGAGGFGGG